jgi:hypothetical protein
MVQDCAGFWVVFKALEWKHTGVCDQSSNVEDGPKNQQGYDSYFVTDLKYLLVRVQPAKAKDVFAGFILGQNPPLKKGVHKEPPFLISENCFT